MQRLNYALIMGEDKIPCLFQGIFGEILHDALL